MDDETNAGMRKMRRVDPSTARSVEGDAEWRLVNAGSMRNFCIRPGGQRGQCEMQHFHLPGFPEVDFAFMIYPAGMGSGPAVEACPMTLALHITGSGCEGVGFEVDLSLEVQKGDGSAIDGRGELLAAPLAGGGRVSCDLLWPAGGEVAVASCHILAAPPPKGDPVLRLSSVWRPPRDAREDEDDDIERLDGEESDD
eukprot:TRINITY_DN25240_c0_g1_i1.p1 TRINITY_DN25240_c0_g1~~TRINITY_DN25240_c0_g1_i1.p1  ORF type:complete len:197 (-),score=41.51 TRINITY_DN25240_c0_g1_i1:124-714(-)